MLDPLICCESQPATNTAFIAKGPNSYKGTCEASLWTSSSWIYKKITSRGMYLEVQMKTAFNDIHKYVSGLPGSLPNADQNCAI